MLQVLAARIGLASGEPLAVLCRKRYKRALTRSVIWAFTQASVFGDDIQGCVAAAIALHIMTGLPWWACILLTLVVSVLLTLAYYYWSASSVEIAIGACSLPLPLFVAPIKCQNLSHAASPVYISTHTSACGSATTGG